jgi:hypothetical protein
MNRKTIAYCIVALFLILGYNAFLIQRDIKLFNLYTHSHS